MANLNEQEFMGRTIRVNEVSWQLLLRAGCCGTACSARSHCLAGLAGHVMHFKLRVLRLWFSLLVAGCMHV
jgi:hypothetical protein